MKYIIQHKKAFEQIYKVASDTDNGLRFPLLDINNYDWKRGYGFNPYFSYFYRRFSCHILSKLKLSDNQKVLFVGCGAGSDEKNIKNLFSNVELWSIDISEEMIKKATSSKSPSNFCLSLAEKLPFPDNSFDRVLSREVIEHTINPQLMINEIKRVLKPGGIAVITTENEESYSPVNFFNNFIKEHIIKILDYSPPLKYKDKAPTLVEMKSYCDSSKLKLVEYFYDGALYKDLPVKWSLFFLLARISLLKPSRLVKITHYFSALENNQRLARIFCDQVKYVLSKDINNMRCIQHHDISYVCPKCFSKLWDSNNLLMCSKCGNTYPSINGIPDFIVYDNNLDKHLDLRNNSHSRNNPKWKPIIYKVVRYGFLILCSSLYIVSATLSTLLVKKNRTSLSNILSPNDPFQKYLKT